MGTGLASLSTQLIQGAKDVHSSKQMKYDFSKITDPIEKAMEEVKAEKKIEEDKIVALEDQFKVNAQKIQMNALGDNHFDVIHNETSAMGEAYNIAVRDGDDKEATKLLKQLTDMTTTVATTKTSFEEYADNVKNNMYSKGMKPRQKEITAFISDQDNIPVWGDKGYEWTMPDGEVVTMEDFEENQKLKDEVVSKEIIELGTAQRTAGKDGSIPFDEGRASATILGFLEDDDTKRSMMFDDIGNNGRIWADDLKEHAFFAAMSENNGEPIDYSIFDKIVPGGDDILLGVADPGETHWADNISKNDQALIIDALTNDDNEFYNDELTTSLLKDYYVEGLRGNYNTGGNQAMTLLDKQQALVAEQNAKLEAANPAHEGESRTAYNARLMSIEGSETEVSDGEGGWSYRNKTQQKFQGTDLGGIN